jgi:hypothetical protein
MLQGQSLWVAFLAGLWAGPGPHVEMVGALSVILASGAAANTQAAAVAAYAIVSFAFAEIPLTNYLLAPANTSAFLNRVPECCGPPRRGRSRRTRRVGGVSAGNQRVRLGDRPRGQRSVIV